MDKVFIAAAFIAMIGVVISLFGGLFMMGRGRPQDHKTSNKMMQLRVICQGIAIVCLFLAYATKQ
jgi:predicted permease